MGEKKLGKFDLGRLGAALWRPTAAQGAQEAARGEAAQRGRPRAAARRHAPLRLDREREGGRRGPRRVAACTPPPRPRA